MGRYDNIDIFFIALISAYFITLLCIIISLIIIKIKSIVKEKRVNKKTLSTIEIKEIKPTKEEKKKENDKTKFRLTDSAIIKKLFMTKVRKEEETQKETKLRKEKVKVLITTRIKPEDKISEKDFKIKKEPTNKIEKVIEKKEASKITAKELKQIEPKVSTKKATSQGQKTNTSKKKVSSKTASKSGTKKNTNTKTSSKGNSTKKRATSNTNKAKKPTSAIKKKTPTKTNNRKTVKK